MRITVFSTKSFDRQFLEAANRQHHHELVFLEAALSERTAMLASDSPAVCVFVNDIADAKALRTLFEQGTRLVALRSAGFNNVDVAAADELGMTVLRVPAYSPHAVAEHTVGLMLTLNRKLHRAIPRVRDHNFALDGLLGFDFYRRTVGVIGTGKIGAAVVNIMAGFGCRILAYDLHRNPQCEAAGVEYVSLDDLLKDADIITLHCPLTPETHHLIHAQNISKMKHGVMLINTSRGAVIDTRAVLEALKSGQIGYLGLDVYEEEGDLFFRDLSDTVMQDDVFARLLTFPNVVITAHQAFFTREALTSIAQTTLQNVTDFEQGSINPANRVTQELVVA